MSDIIHCATSWYAGGQSNHMDGSPSPPNFREIALPVTLCGLQQAGGLLMQVFRWLPPTLQCAECRYEAAFRSRNNEACARPEHIAAVEIGLTLLAADTRPWRDADPHGTGNNPHVWFDVAVRRWGYGGTVEVLIKDAQCTCGVYKSAYDAKGCHDRRCQREAGHGGLHMSRWWDSNSATEIVDEWGNADLRDVAGLPPRTLRWDPRPDPLLSWPRELTMGRDLDSGDD